MRDADYDNTQTTPFDSNSSIDLNFNNLKQGVWTQVSRTKFNQNITFYDQQMFWKGFLNYLVKEVFKSYGN